MTRRTPTQYNYDKLEFDEHWLTKHFTPMSSKIIEYIVVHHMTIVGKGNGSALDACYATWQNRLASSQYGVDGVMIGHFVRDKDYAWAQGTSAGNTHGISIEHANSKAGPSWTVADNTWKTGAKLAAYLHKKYKLGRPVKDKTLRKHSSFVSTACPGPYLGGTIWNQYVAEAQRVYDEITGTAQTYPGTVKKVAKYRVTSTSLYGYSALTSNPKPIATTLVKGDVFMSQAYLSVKGHLWIQHSNDDWFDGSHLDLVVATPTKPAPAPKPTPPPVGPLLRVATQNLAIGNPTGKKSWKTRIPKAAKQITSKNVDVFNGQEAGTGPDLDVLSKALAPGLILAPGGSDWRHIFYNPKTVTRVASGVAQITPLYNGDTKQFAWLVGILEGKRFLDVSLHLESADGTAADTIRVKQMANVLAQATALAGQHGVEIGNVILAGDTNSSNQVRVFMESKGWASAAKVAKSALSAKFATFNNWKTNNGGDHIDYTFNRASVEVPLWVQWPGSALSDHNLQASDRRLI